MDNAQEEPEFNKPIWEWQIEEVLKWLLLEFNFEEEVLKNFVFHEIDGLDLIDLTEDNLKFDLKISKINLRKKLLRRIVDKLKNYLSHPDVDNYKNNNNNNLICTLNKRKNSKNDFENTDNPNKLLPQSFSFNKKENDFKSKVSNSNIKSNLDFPANAGLNINKKSKVSIVLHYTMDENLKKMKFLCFPTNKVETIIKEFKENLTLENKKLKLSEKYDNISICDENGYLIAKETYISELINSDLEENNFYINKNLHYYFFENNKELKEVPKSKRKKDVIDNEYKIKTQRTDSNHIKRLNIENFQIENFEENSNLLNAKNRENYFHTQRNEASGFESLEEFEKKMIKNKKLIKFLNKDKKSTNQINFNSKSLNNNYTSAFKDKVNKFSQNNNSSLMETALKNKYLSFEKLDSLEKNITKFLDKNENHSKEYISTNPNEKEKVTINSYYNISNLNNFNDKALFNSVDKVNNEDKKSKMKNNGDIILNNKIKSHNEFKKKSNNLTKSERKRKRFVSEEDLNNDNCLDSEVDIRENNLENSEIKKTALKNTKHVFNLNLGKIIDGDKLKIEKKIEEKAQSSKRINYKEFNESYSETDLNYSKESETLNKNTRQYSKTGNNKNGSKTSNFFENLNSGVKYKSIQNNVNNNYQSINEENSEDSNLNCGNKKIKDDRLRNNSIKKKENFNKNNFDKKPLIKHFNCKSNSLQKFENSNTERDREIDKNDSTISNNYNDNYHKNILEENSLPKNESKDQNFNMPKSKNHGIIDIKKAEINNISKQKNNQSKISNNKSISNQYIKIEEHPSLKKSKKKEFDEDHCNYGEDVKNTKKSLYDAFFKNIDTDESHYNTYNNANNKIPYSKNIHNNNNYCGFINNKDSNSNLNIPRHCNNINNSNNKKYSKNTSETNSFFGDDFKPGNITHRQNSNKYYSKIINKNSIYGNYNSNIPNKNIYSSIEKIHNENQAGNLTSRNENNSSNYQHSFKSKSIIFYGIDAIPERENSKVTFNNQTKIDNVQVKNFLNSIKSKKFNKI